MFSLLLCVLHTLPNILLDKCSGPATILWQFLSISGLGVCKQWTELDYSSLQHLCLTGRQQSVLRVTVVDQNKPISVHVYVTGYTIGLLSAVSTGKFTANCCTGLDYMTTVTE